MKVSYYFHESPIKICTEKNPGITKILKFKIKLSIFIRASPPQRLVTEAYIAHPLKHF